MNGSSRLMGTVLYIELEQWYSTRQDCLSIHVLETPSTPRRTSPDSVALMRTVGSTLPSMEQEQYQEAFFTYLMIITDTDATATRMRSTYRNRYLMRMKRRPPPPHTTKPPSPEKG